MSESSYFIIVYFYYKSNKIFIIFDSIEEFRENQQNYLIKFHTSVLRKSLDDMKKVLNILNDKLNSFPNIFQDDIEQEDKCNLCWTNLTEFEYNRIPTPNECTSDWIINIMNLVYYGEIDNINDENNGYVINYFHNNTEDIYDDIPYKIIKEMFPNNIHPL
jgi:hypothetical protein